MSNQKYEYGVGDASYKAAGELPGLTKLVDAFYDFMDTLPNAKVVRGMHRENLDESRLKLSYFLSGWLGGPKLYALNFGRISIPKAHAHLQIGRNEVDAWMACMQRAVELQPYDESFKEYLIEQLRIPAERILVFCEKIDK